MNPLFTLTTAAADYGLPIQRSLLPPTLRCYQLKMLTDALSLMRQGYRRILIQAPTGAGKTVLAAALLGGVMQLGLTGEFIVHRKELIKQTSSSFERSGLMHGFVASGFQMDLDSAIILAGVQTLVNRLGLMIPPNLAVVDECFIAGTLVSGRPIETLKVGDYVTAFDEKTGVFAPRRITKLFKNPLKGCMVRVDVVGHHATYATERHPFWTQRGWVDASDLKVGDYVLTRFDFMHDVWPTCGHAHCGSATDISQERAGVLQPGMCQRVPFEDVFGDYESDKPAICVRSNEGEQSHAERKHPCEDERVTSSEGSPSCCSGRERSPRDESRIAAHDDVRRPGLCSPVHCCDRCQTPRISDTLQDRLRESASENCDRSGWCLTSKPSTTGARPEEGRISHWKRVEGVQVLEPENIGKSAGSDFDGYVYNIEVDEFHTYIANGIVVHNCHHATSTTWANVLQSYGGAYIIGLTATPERLDGRGLNEQFDAMVKGPSVAWLIENGFLSPYELFAPMIPDMDGVGEVGGEYNKKRTGEIMGQSKVVGNIVEHYLRLAPGEQGIVFAPTREVSRKYADAFRAEGIAAMHVDGDTDDKERDRFDDAFRAGDIRIGCNVDLFGEGYDVPNISYMADGSPSKSRIKVAQRWGRPLRMSEGKTRAIIADHAGNALPPVFGGQGHGLPDDDYEYSMEGRERRRKAAVSDATPITQCPKCFLVYPSSSKHCPRCETATPPMPRQVKQQEGKLSKVEREALKRAAAVRRKQEERECENFDQFYSLGRARGYEFPRQWAVRQCKIRRISTSSERIL